MKIASIETNLLQKIKFKNKNKNLYFRIQSF